MADHSILNTLKNSLREETLKGVRAMRFPVGQIL